MLLPLFKKSAPITPCRVLIPPIVAAEKTVIVLGCARGGTSMVAGLVRKLGIFMGENIDGPNHEDQDFMHNDIETLRTVVERRNAEHPYWGWKNTDEGIERIRQLLPLLRNPHVIVVFRNVLSIATSFNRYETIGFLDGLEDIGARYAAITRFTNTLSCPVLAVSYDAAILSKTETTRAVAAFLGLSYDRNLLKKAAGFIDSKGGYRFIVEPITLTSAQTEEIPCKTVFYPLSIDSVNAQPEGRGYLGVENDPQFILTRNDKRVFGSRIQLQFNIALPETVEKAVVIYYSACGIFIEQHALKLPVMQGLNTLELEFSTPVKALRIDPLDSNAYFELSDIRVCGSARLRSCTDTILSVDLHSN